MREGDHLPVIYTGYYIVPSHLMHFIMKIRQAIVATYCKIICGYPGFRILPIYSWPALHRSEKRPGHQTVPGRFP